MDVSPDWMLNDFKLSHPQKEPMPISMAFEVIFIDVNFEQLLNAPLPIFITFEVIFIDVSLEQPENAFTPMLVMPMLVTFEGSVVIRSTAARAPSISIYFLVDVWLEELSMSLSSMLISPEGKSMNLRSEQSTYLLSVDYQYYTL